MENFWSLSLAKQQSSSWIFPHRLLPKQNYPHSVCSHFKTLILLNLCTYFSPLLMFSFITEKILARKMFTTKIFPTKFLFYFQTSTTTHYNVPKWHGFRPAYFKEALAVCHDENRTEQNKLSLSCSVLGPPSPSSPSLLVPSKASKTGGSFPPTETPKAVQEPPSLTVRIGNHYEK